MAEEFDQQVYDDLIAQGKSERVAKAKAKAAAVRQQKQQEAAEQPAEEKQPATAGASAQGQGAQAGGGQAAAQQAMAGAGVMTPEQRQERVRQALQAKKEGTGGQAGQQPPSAKFAGQEHTHRLLAMVPPSGIQQIRGKQEDKVYTWPHLISSEFISLLAVTAGLTVMSVFVSAPLENLANPTLTPNPSKAPWYFMGLQELLLYFHPMIAGVTIPTVMLVGLATTPYTDRNPSRRPENRKTAIVMFTLFMVFWATLVMVGSFFRGPGLNWVWPWVDGLWFSL
jgi:hypothetical protein